MAQTYREERRLNWGEADPAGTIYAPQALDFAIQAIEGLWVAAIGAPFREIQRTRKLAAPWVRTDCTFERPIFAGDRYALDVALAKIGNSSLTYRVRASAEDGTLLFAATLVSVVIDMATMRPAAIPDDMRGGFSRYLAEA